MAATYHLALPKGFHRANYKNWIVVQQISPGVFVRFNSTHKYKRDDFEAVGIMDVVELVSKLQAQIATYQDVLSKLLRKSKCD